MAAGITDKERGVGNRALPPAWATEPPVWGDPVSPERVQAMLDQIERKKVYRFARPDGSRYETDFTNPTSARAWASEVGHRFEGEVASDRAPAPTPRATADRGLEQPLSAPPLVQAPRRPPPPPPPPDDKHRKRPVPPPAPPSPPPTPKVRPARVPPPTPEEYGIIQYLRDDFVDTTMKESMPLISKWFGRVGKALKAVPGLQGVGEGYEVVAEIADGLQLMYELVHEVNQAEAFEKGGKEVVKRTKPVKKIAERLLKKKYPGIPEPVRKKAAEVLENLFEKYVSDPAIEKGRETMQEMDEHKDLDQPLWHELKKLLETTPNPVPTP